MFNADCRHFFEDLTFRSFTVMVHSGEVTDEQLVDFFLFCSFKNTYKL